MDGICFIEKHYKNLYSSNEVKYANRFYRNSNKYEDIKNYFDRLERISKRAINAGKKDLLYDCFFRRYIIKREDIPKRFTEEEKDKIIAMQKESLLPWLDYLNSSCKEDYWIKYYIFQGMVQIGTYKESKDIFMKRSSKTTSPFIEFDFTVIDKLISYVKSYVCGTLYDKELENLIKSNGFSTLYYYFLKEHKNDINNIANGVWIKYNKGSREDAFKLWNSIVYKNTFWCTRFSNDCLNQICGGGSYKPGDFYVYYTNDVNENPTVPRVAIRFEGDRIKEIRGVLDSSQNLEPSLTGVVKRKLDSFNLSDRDKKRYLKAIEDNRKITKLNQKTANGIPLTQEEMDYIYEINEKLSTFAEGEDKRIHEIRSKNIITDADYLLKASTKIRSILKYASVELKNNRELIKKIIKDDYTLIDLVGERLKDDIEFMWPILLKDPLYIRNCGPKIKKNPTVALVVISHNLDAFRWMNVNLMNNPEFLEAADRVPGFTKKYVLTNKCDIIDTGDSNENK